MTPEMFPLYPMVFTLYSSGKNNAVSAKVLGSVSFDRFAIMVLVVARFEPGVVMVVAVNAPRSANPLQPGLLAAADVPLIAPKLSAS